MEILFVFGDANYILTHRHSLIGFLKEKKYKVMIACPASPLADKLNQRGFTLFPLQYLDRGSLNPLTELKAVYELYVLIKKTRPTLIHTVAMKPTLQGLMAVFLRGRQKAPRLVATFGGLGYLFISQNLGIRLIKWLVIRVFNFLFKRTKAHLVLQNDDDHTLLTTAGLSLPFNVHLIRGSGVCPVTYPFTPPLPSDKGGVRVVYAGRLLKDKGLLELIEAIKILKKKPLTATFHWYGDPDPKNPASLTAQDLEAWQAEGLITWHESTPEPAPLYQGAHIVVLPSYREGLPKALLEAALTGRALVATDVPGCRDIVIHEKTGLLVPPYDSMALAEAIERFIRDTDFRHQMGTNAHQHVMNCFSDPLIHRQHHELYQNLLSSADI